MNLFKAIRTITGQEPRFNALTPNNGAKIFNSSRDFTLQRDSVEVIKEAGRMKKMQEAEIYSLMQTFQKLADTTVFSKELVNDNTYLEQLALIEDQKSIEDQIQIVKNELFQLQQKQYEFWSALSEGKSKHEWKVIFKKVKSFRLKNLIGINLMNRTIVSAIEEVLSDRKSSSIKKRDPNHALDSTYAVTGKGQTLKQSINEL